MLSLFLSNKKREEIKDEIDDLLMKQYYCRCRLDEAKKKDNQQLVEHEERKLDEYEVRIQKLKKKLN